MTSVPIKVVIPFILFILDQIRSDKNKYRINSLRFSSLPRSDPISFECI